MPRHLTCSCLASLLASAAACSGSVADQKPPRSIRAQQSIDGATVDPAPVVTFVQVAHAVGIDRSREPASAGPFTSSGALAYGSWLADLDGDGRLDYYGVNHGQRPHLSGLFINDGAGGFGENLFTVAVQVSPEHPADLGLTNEITFVGDLTGDGRVDLFFRSWSGFGAMCANQGPFAGPDWSGPRFLCFGTTDALAFGDVNGDGRIDVLTVSPSGFDTYEAYYANTASYIWRLNNGDQDIQTWPTTASFVDLRVSESTSPSPPFLDLNGDGIPDKIVGIPLPAGSRGTYGTLTAGKQVFLGQAGGGYVLQPATGLEGVTTPITAIEDVDDDGCLDIGTDVTGYRDNQEWWVQGKVGDRCTLTFRFVPRTDLPYFPGFKRYAVDIDNSGLLSKIVIIHGAYGNNDHRPVGVSIYRKLADGTYAVIPPAESGIDITGPGTEFYADNLSPGDWDDDGRMDLAGTGMATLPGTDDGFALWTSRLATSNGWIKISLPTVTGFFTGAATIEVFDAGFVGDAAHLVTPARRLYSGRTWGSQVHHLGIGTRAAVDVRVTFPDGQQTIRAGVGPGSRLVIEPGTLSGPVAVVTAAPTLALVGEPVSFDGSASRAATGTIVGYAWDFGDGTGAAGAKTSHAYSAAGTFVARLTVTDDRGGTGTAAVTITVRAAAPDTTPPAVVLSAPIGGATVAGVTTIQAAASDDTGVTLVDFLVDGAVVATDAAAPYAAAWDSASVADGSHTLAARAHDAAGNVGVSAPVSVIVRNAAAAPGIRFVQEGHAVPQTPQATVTVTLTAAQGAGDLNVVVVGWNDTTARIKTVTDAKGNSYRLAIGPTQHAGALSQSIYYAAGIAAAAAGANAVTVAFDQPARYVDIRVLEYAGLDAAAPLDVAAGSSGTGTQSASDTATTTNANDLLVGANTVETSTAGAGAGYTSRVITNPDGDIAEDRIVSTTGTYGATAPLGSSGRWVMQMVAFKAAGAAAPAPDSQPPTAPASLVASAVSASEIDLAWMASSDDVGVTGYLVERCQGAGCSGFAQVASVAGTSFADTGLAAGTSYGYRVRARDAAGNLGAYSSVASAATPPGAAATPAYVQGAFSCPQTPQSTVRVTYAGAQAAGGLDVVIAGWNDSSARVISVTDSAGNVYALAVGPTVIAGAASQAIYYAKNIVAAPAGANVVTVAFDRPAIYPDVRIAEYRGVDTAAPLDVAAAASGTASPSDSGPAVTTNPVDLLVAGNLVLSGTSGAGSGFTSRMITSPDSDILEDRTVTAAGTYRATAPLTSPAPWIMQMVAFKAAVAPAP